MCLGRPGGAGAPGNRLSAEAGSERRGEWAAGGLAAPGWAWLDPRPDGPGERSQGLWAAVRGAREARGKHPALRERNLLARKSPNAGRGLLNLAGKGGAGGRPFLPAAQGVPPACCGAPTFQSSCAPPSQGGYSLPPFVPPRLKMPTLVRSGNDPELAVARWWSWASYSTTGRRPGLILAPSLKQKPWPDSQIHLGLSRPFF